MADLDHEPKFIHRYAKPDTSIYVEHVSEITGSRWQIWFNEDLDVIVCWINGEVIKVSKEMDWMIYRYCFKKNYL